MLISSIIGFAVVGVIASAVLTRFWDSIKNWLNTVVADAVEKHFGYSWRNKIIKAVDMQLAAALFEFIDTEYYS